MCTVQYHKNLNAFVAVDYRMDLSKTSKLCKNAAASKMRQYFLRSMTDGISFVHKYRVTCAACTFVLTQCVTYVLSTNVQISPYQLVSKTRSVIFRALAFKCQYCDAISCCLIVYCSQLLLSFTCLSHHFLTK